MIIHRDQEDFIPGMHGWFNIRKSDKQSTIETNTKEKKHMFFSLDAEKVFDKIQHPFMLKDLERTRIKGPYLSIIQAISNIKINGEKLEANS